MSKANGAIENKDTYLQHVSLKNYKSIKDAEIYFKQIVDDPDFSNTPLHYQNGIMGAFIQHLLGAYYKGDAKDRKAANDLVTKFNESNSKWSLGSSLDEFDPGVGGIPVYYDGKLVGYMGGTPEKAQN